MGRPTISDLAKVAGVSIATVNRVIGGVGNVKAGTMQRVREAAVSIGFYGVGSIDSRVAAARTRYKLGFLLNQPSRAFYKLLAQHLKAAAERVTDVVIEARIEFVEDLSPQNIAEHIVALGQVSDAIAVVAPVHPLVIGAIETLQQADIPVFSLLSPVEAGNPVHFIGVDPWKVGRTAGWAAHHICKQAGKLGVLVGNHRYRGHEMNESGFRSYIREYAPEFTVLEALPTFESTAVAQEMTEKLLAENPDLSAVYVAGGGITGVLAAMRASDRAGKVMVIGYELMDVTRQGLLDGVMTLAIANPLTRMGDEAVAGMIKAVNARSMSGNYSVILPFDLYTRENI